MKIDIREDLSFKNEVYVFNDKSIKSTMLNNYSNPRETNKAIVQIPVIVENKNVHLSDDNRRIVFNEDIDWMHILYEKSIDHLYGTDIDETEKIDWSEASVGAPSPYILQKQH